MADPAAPTSLVQDLVRRFNEDPAVRHLLTRLPRLSFVRIDQISLLSVRKPAPILFFFKNVEPFQTQQITFSKRTPPEIPLGRLYQLMSGGNLFAHLFEMGDYRPIQGPGYAGVTKLGQDANYAGVTTFYLHNQIRVMAPADHTAVLLLRQGVTTWVDRTGYYRKEKD